MSEKFREWCQAHPDATEEEIEHEWGRQAWLLMFFNTLGQALLSL